MTPTGALLVLVGAVLWLAALLFALALGRMAALSEGDGR